MTILNEDNSILNALMVVLIDVLFKQNTDFIVVWVVDVLEPSKLSNRVGFHGVRDLVLEEGFLVEGAVISSDYGTLAESQAEFCLSVDFVTDIDFAIHDEEHLLNVLDGLLDDGSNGFHSWLKHLENTQHKVSIILISPVHERILSFNTNA